jgi:hypothetical protein
MRGARALHSCLEICLPRLQSFPTLRHVMHTLTTMDAAGGNVRERET